MELKEDTAVETTETPSLSLQDLAAVVQIIDLCSQRGAFQGSELEAVGGLRGRVQAFVAANTPEQEPEGDDNDE